MKPTFGFKTETSNALFIYKRQNSIVYEQSPNCKVFV